MIVDVRHDGDGRVHRNTCHVGLGELSLSDTADDLLSKVIEHAMHPVLDAVRALEVHRGEVVVASVAAP